MIACPPRVLDTVVGRTAVVLAAAIACALALSYGLFLSHRGEWLRAEQMGHVTENLAKAVQMADAADAAARPKLLLQLRTPRLRIEMGNSPIVSDQSVAEDDRALGEQLTADLPGREIRVHRDLSADEYGVILISAGLKDGSWINANIRLRPPRLGTIPVHFVEQMVVSLLAIALVALVAVSRLTKPVTEFALAAERLGQDVNAPGLPETGPREFRQAAKAFNVMQDRIRRMVEDRTLMLAAISHDLRTPITRMRLRVEFVEDENIQAKMQDDLTDMDRMIESALAFARDVAKTEERHVVDVASLVQGVASDFAETGFPIEYEGPDQLILPVYPLALKRAVVNVMDNAAKYGHAAHVSLHVVGGAIEICVDDRGPGIPVGDREAVFAPFVRLEESRNRGTGGSGLGLSIARSSIRAHGGDVTLSDSPSGGLRVTLRIPQLEPGKSQALALGAVVRPTHV